MNTAIAWLLKPLAQELYLRAWFSFFFLVFGLWILVPIGLGTHFQAEYLAISLSPRNVAILASRSFGEEFVFRGLPLMCMFALFPKKILLNVCVGIIFVYLFGMWHEWVTSANTFLGIGGGVLCIAYVKFGGADGRPMSGVVACGSIHTACNVTVAVIANMLT
jgi:hypothetical protein